MNVEKTIADIELLEHIFTPPDDRRFWQPIVSHRAKRRTRWMSIFFTYDSDRGSETEHEPVPEHLCRGLEAA
jgi:hypothetical protein